MLFYVATPMLGIDTGWRKADQQKESQISAIYHPPPQYPLEARRKGMEGVGLFRVDIEPENGAVENVKVLRSTGHGILDSAGVQAFRKWRFPRGEVTSVKIPLEFKLRQITSENAKEYALHTPPPLYPFVRHPQFPLVAYQRKSARAGYGSGVFALRLDYKTGKVLEVETLHSTGRKALDDAAISGFRRWRFKPGSPFDVVRVPITFLGAP